MNQKLVKLEDHMSDIAQKSHLTKTAQSTANDLALPRTPEESKAPGTGSSHKAKRERHSVADIDLDGHDQKHLLSKMPSLEESRKSKKREKLRPKSHSRPHSDSGSSHISSDLKVCSDVDLREIEMSPKRQLPAEQGHQPPSVPPRSNSRDFL